MSARTHLSKIAAVALFALCFTAALVGAQDAGKSLSFSSGYSVQTLRIEGDFIKYQYEEDKGKLRRTGQVRISDLDLADATIGGGDDVFGVEIKCKNDQACLGYDWIDARVGRGQPSVKGTNAVRSLPLDCRQKEVCAAFLAALKNRNAYPTSNTGDDHRPATAAGPNVPPNLSRRNASDNASSPTVGAPLPQPKPLPAAPTIEEAHFSHALSVLGSLISVDSPARIGKASEATSHSSSDFVGVKSLDQTATDNTADALKHYVRGWVQSLVRNLDDQKVREALHRDDERLPKEFLRDRDLWNDGFIRISHPTDRNTSQKFVDRFFDLFDLWDNYQ